MGSALDLFFGASSGSSTTTKFLLFGYHGLHTVVHVLDKVNLRASESPLVGNVIDVVSRLRVFAVDATDLDVELVSNSLKLWHSGTKFRQGDMNRPS